jgi:hypothetical protein
MSDHALACNLCGASCPFHGHRPQTYLDLGGVGFSALAVAIIANSFRDLLVCEREERQAALDWLFSRDGEDLLTQLDIEPEGALKQAALMFRCGEKRAGLFQRGA